MTLDVKLMEKLDGFAALVSENGDHEALSLINNLPKNTTEGQPYKRAAYVRYYFEAKRGYREKALLDTLNLFDKDI